MTNSIIVIIPTFNEAKNIEKLIFDLMSINIGLDILVVDDNSLDGTQFIVQSIAEKYDQVNLIVRESKLGLGSAYREGYKSSLNNNYDYFVQMDADFSHQVDDLKKMLDVRKNHDIVIGSRYIQGGKTIGWPRRRKLLSKFANLFVEFATSLKIKDSTSGFRIYSQKAINIIDYSSTKSEGYGFQIEMSFLASKENLRIVEIPISFHERQEGASKINKRIIFEAFFLVLKLGFLKKK